MNTPSRVMATGPWPGTKPSAERTTALVVMACPTVTVEAGPTTLMAVALGVVQLGPAPAATCSGVPPAAGTTMIALSENGFPSSVWLWIWV